ncbi:MAG TPA: tyrosine--tRNA ligase [Candidatus Paceibacterota bacterium]|jgi:tyrosyl-tRNA synthetase|nr:tyrosine--tRNA ligase [Candidatus Paceibacterota bacterium]
MKNNFFEDLSQRGLIYQKTEGIAKVFDRKITLYWGIDLTSDSLHLGHLLGLITLKRAIKHKHFPIVLVASGTTMVGDPSGKNKERPILSREIIKKNKKEIEIQIKNILGTGKFLILDNYSWLSNLKVLEFLREVGKFIPINTMLEKEAVKTRMQKEEGISFAEFSYQLLQAYDFLHLFKNYNCLVQIGGSEQWGNIVQGIELIRKKMNGQAYGFSFPLIIDPKTGKKFGKTEGGKTIWLSRSKTPSFEFYQFFINISDELIPTFIRFFSLKDLRQIKELENKWQQNKESRLLQKELAFELTSLVFGLTDAKQAKKVSEILFGKSSQKLSQADFEFIKNSIPHQEIKNENFLLEEVLVRNGLCFSKGQARKLIDQNGVTVKKYFSKYFLVRKGKKEYLLLIKK